MTKELVDARSPSSVVHGAICRAIYKTSSEGEALEAMCPNIAPVAFRGADLAASRNIGDENVACRQLFFLGTPIGYDIGVEHTDTRYPEVQLFKALAWTPTQTNKTMRCIH